MKPVATYQKLRGGYYTPQPIADFLADWAIHAPDTTVLEPGCEETKMLRTIWQKLRDRRINRKLDSALKRV